MADNKTFKLPRHLIARMADNNPQVIAALENMENKTLTLDERLELITLLAEEANANAQQAAIMALQLLNNQSENLPPVASIPEVGSYLPLVAYPSSCDSELSTVAYAPDSQSYLSSIGA